MKARVKATNKIVDIYEQTLLSTFDSNDVRLDEVEFLEGDTNFTHDYWTRLEHQYAGMAMQGILANSAFDDVSVSDIAITSIKMATSLIERLKGERK